MGDRFNGFSVSVSLPFLTGRKKVKAAELQYQAVEMQQELELIKLSANMSGDYEKALRYRELLDQYAGIELLPGCPSRFPGDTIQLLSDRGAASAL